MAELTSQCPCAKRMRLPPRLRGERPPAAGTLTCCVFCERIGVASRTEAYSRAATLTEINGERARLEELRDESEVLYPKRRRRPLPVAVV